MPQGGAFDKESLFLANALLGNEALSAAVEIPLMGGSFSCERQTSVAVVGADCQVKVNGCPPSRQCRLTLDPGDELTIEPYAEGARLYLAVAGGIEVKFVLGSCSGRVVSKSELIVGSGTGSLPAARLAQTPASIRSRTLRFLPGPQAEFFDLAWFRSVPFKVSNDSDRKGVRLIGEVETRAAEIPSEPACFGTVQVTPSGNPIVLGPDGPTIGGYPKIATVISADLDKVGQLVTGDEIIFERVSPEAALSLWMERSLRLEKLANQVKLERLGLGR